MGKLLYTINTVNNFMDIIFNPFGKPFANANPDIEVYNIMDDSLLVDTRKYNGMTPTIASRMLNYAKGRRGLWCRWHHLHLYLGEPRHQNDPSSAEYPHD